jgi:hypothetical protein
MKAGGSEFRLDGLQPGPGGSGIARIFKCAPTIGFDEDQNDVLARNGLEKSLSIARPLTFRKLLLELAHVIDGAHDE